MPVIPHIEPTTHELHGARFHAYAGPTRSGSTQLCAWRVELAPGTTGVPHEVSHEEVLLVLDGTLVASLDGRRHPAGPGDVVVVPAGTLFALDNVSPAPSSAWVSTSVGLTATLPDGSAISPPWTR